MTNDHTIAGRIGQDPVLRYSASGVAFLSLSIAVNRSTKNATGAWVEETTWWDVTTFKSLAEQIADTVKKGDHVIASGRIEISSYEKDGIKRKAIALIANSFGTSILPVYKKSENAPAYEDAY